jgi:ribosomal-protein-alanine N-acetyltransferase
MIQTREMRIEDIDDILSIENECFSNPWSKQAFIGEMANKHAYYLVAEYNQEIIGYIGVWRIFDEGHITNIAIRKENQNKGFGYELLKDLIDRLEEFEISSLTLEVRRSNNQALALYRKMGFEELGIRKNYYTNPVEDAIIMWYR